VLTSLSTCCHLCAQIKGDAEHDLLHPLLGQPSYRPPLMAESDDFVLMASLGALVDGHVLLCPRRHLRSFAELSPKKAGAAAEFSAATQRRLGALYDHPVQAFEHGSASSGPDVACSIEHAHLHLLPVEIELWPLVAEMFSWTLVREEEELAALVDGAEYLRIATADGWQVAKPADPIPSQLMRRKLAHALGREDWDWRRSPRAAEVRSTHRRLAATG
jgi:diadenosine tetraphosphate (Ap4A) HIT family hydrolase